MMQTLLIVDDDPLNINILHSLLGKQYHLKAATSGAKALQILKNFPDIDLILMDIIMPEMDGYQVCEKIKSDPQIKDIPLIFVTAKSEEDDETRGLSSGAVDFITKPFVPAILKARVETHLKVYQQKRELEKSYEELKSAENARDALIHMIIHDLNNPLGAISGYTQLLQLDLKKEEIEIEELLGFTDNMYRAVQQMSALIQGILDVSKLESGNMNVSIDPIDAVLMGKEICQMMGAAHPGYSLKFSASKENISVLADKEILRRILQNLIGNAFKHSPARTPASLHISEENGEVVFCVEDQGSGIPEKYKEKIFSKFFQVEIRKEGKKSGAGLGLTFCKMAVEKQGGKIWFESEEGKGSKFKFTLPCSHPQ